MFAERRMNVQKKLKIMAARDRNRFRPLFEGDEEVDMLYLNCNVASRPSLSCDGLVCIPIPGWINVLNPSTGEFLRFSSGRDPRLINDFECVDSKFDVFPGFWTMGFGRDNVNGSYKIVRMLFDRHFENRYCQILDVNIGEWRKQRQPPYFVGYREKSACVNGSIYWSQALIRCKLLAFDLYSEEFRDVPTPPRSEICERSCQKVNLEDRLVLAVTYTTSLHWNVKIWSMDAHDGTRSITYSIRLFSKDMNSSIMNHFQLWFWTRPLAVSKRGNLFFHDNEKRLYKYYTKTDEVRILERDICVISPFIENLLPLRRPDSVTKIRTYGFQFLDHAPSSRISNFLKRLENQNNLLTTAAAAVALATLVYFIH
ncbi:F-box associated domain type 1 [Arabidopsis thaliana x Arabidopsis arenosa]|nr:F-box associated domain type 1 [Arabidopsis thaliana x Arabidopsis arenosa]